MGDLPKGKPESPSAIGEELNDKLAKLETSHLRGIEMKKSQMKNHMDRAKALNPQIKELEKEIAQFGKNDEFDVEDAKLRLAEMKKFRDGFMEVARKASEDVKWQETQYPIDVEYVKRHGCAVWEEDDEELGERRIRELEKEMGIPRAEMDVMEFSDVFVAGLAVVYKGN